MVDTATPTTPTPTTAPASESPAPARKLRIALAHDWLCGLRGGEHVLERLAELVTREHEAAGLFVMFDDGLPLTPTVDAMPHTVSRVGHWPGATRLRRWLLPMYPRAVAELSDMLEREHRRRAIDLLISTSSAAVKGLRPPRGVPHLCYCHSPARYVWSRSDEYAGGLRGLGLLVWGERFRRWDAASAANVTRFVANSEYTARLISQSYRRGATVVYPPLRDEFLAWPVEQATGDDRPWLVVSALEPYKRVDLAILAANQAGRPLVIVGNGSQRETLEKLAGPTVRFVGRASEEELMAWYRRARLVLFPQVEDFGLVAVEAQACGVPVVARRDGGALETVVEGKTGAFFGEPSPQAILRAVEACPDACAAACRANAERFSGATFDAAMRREIAETMNSGAA